MRFCPDCGAHLGHGTLFLEEGMLVAHGDEILRVADVDEGVVTALTADGRAMYFQGGAGLTLRAEGEDK